MLLDLLIVLAAAKIAAEIAERARVPAVLAEILVGVAVGSSALGLVENGPVLRFLAELGVILLLLQVGLEMDLGELAAVGRASLLVAVAGVVLPFAGGFVVAAGMGESISPAIFVGAALTATSVGITARVFGDLRALSTVEARTVLGAAVADDVLGLVILTVVVRIVSTGSISILNVSAVVAAAAAFLVMGGGVGIRGTPPLFRLIDRRARSGGTLVGLAIVFTLGLAELAGVARLAPIVGAFVAGICLGRSEQADRVRRDVRPIGQLLVPVFFVQIGMDADVGQFWKPSVLGLAGGLLVVAVLGKLAASWAAVGSPGDRWLIGLGMLPRGEVGLIFAGLGLREGVLGNELYAALLLVVLATTLAAPPLLRWRLIKVTVARHPSMPATPMPEGGWLRLTGGEVELRGQPGSHLALRVALEAACLVERGRPGPALLDWFGALDRDLPLVWDAAARRLLFTLLREGNARSWRFLETTGMLDRVLPELADTLRRRRADASELDPVQVLRWATVEEVHRLAGGPEFADLKHPDWLFLAALIIDVSGDHVAPVTAARQIVKRLDLGAAAEQEVALLVTERELLRAAAIRPDGLDEQRVVPLASHLDGAERARALYLLTLAQNDLEPWVKERVGLLHARIQQLLLRSDLTGRQARNLAEQRLAEAQRLAGTAATVERLAHAPRPWLLGQPAADLARQASLLEPRPPRGGMRVQVLGDRVEVGCRDRRGLLASVTGVLAESRLVITDAATATWPDGGVVMAFGLLPHGGALDAGALQERLEATLGRPRTAVAITDAALAFDDDASPWYTIVDVEAPDRPGLLHALTAAFAAADVSIHAARAETRNGVARDRFEVTDRRGAKLAPATQDAFRAALRTGGRTRKAGIFPKHSAHNVETAAS